jgi:excisionase family DNA binding protein
MTVKEAAEQCRLSLRQIWRHIASGRLTVVRLGGRVRIKPEDLDRFIEGKS